MSLFKELSNDFVRDCKRLGHQIGVCTACGEPYCQTESICLAGATQTNE